MSTTTVKYKKNTKVSKQGLTRYYGPLWSEVLGDKVCEPVNMPGLWASEDLPDLETYNKLRDAHYTLTLSDWLEQAASVIEELASEMDEWYNNLPESLQCSDKAETIQAAYDELGSIQMPELLDETLLAVPVIHLPLADQGSRAKRLGEVGEIIKDCIDSLSEIPNAADLISDLESIQIEIQGVEFPGMY